MLDGEQKAVQVPVCSGNIPDEGKNLIRAYQHKKNAGSNEFGFKKKKSQQANRPAQNQHPRRTIKIKPFHKIVFYYRI
ncbi:MAG: hypothetical protein PVF78_07360 [Desulfobacterales bacterium]|jgi:hypothetical protein